MSGFNDINKIAIIGVGLIGGSLGLALKSKGFQGKIVGLGRRLSSLESALAKGAVDEIYLDFSEALKDTDLVIVCTPVDLIPQIVKQAAAYTRPGCIITDVGSIKRKITEEIEAFLPEHLKFVGSHPMAGSEKSGVGAAHSKLFENAVCIVTKTEDTNLIAIEVAKSMWQMVGAKIKLMSPQEHDLLIAAASHLPHLIASVLTKTVGEIDSNGKKALDFVATGFKDTTRIASGAPEIWKSILLQNSDYIFELIDLFARQLRDFKEALKNADESEIERYLALAKTIRDSIKD